MSLLMMMALSLLQVSDAKGRPSHGQRAAAEARAYADCTIGEAKRLDDGTADIQTVEAGVVQACDGAFQAMMAVELQGLEGDMRTKAQALYKNTPADAASAAVQDERDRRR